MAVPSASPASAAPAARTRATAVPLAVLRAIRRAPFEDRTGRELVYVVLSAPLAACAFVALGGFVLLGMVLSITLVGFPLVVAAIVLGAREYGAVPRWCLRKALGETVDAPRRRRPRSPGFLAWLRASVTDLDGWRALVHVVVAFPVTVIGAYAVVLSAFVSLALITYPLWWHAFTPENTDAAGSTRHSGIQLGEVYFDTWPLAFAVTVAGIAVAYALPWIGRFFALVDRLLVRALLGPTRLSARVDDLEATRAHAVEDSAATLRRIERDLHDGTQARLVALAMHLDMAKEELAGSDVDRARELLDQAHHNATEAITELRDVTRAIHPPALDRGLDEALATLAARSGVPARVETRLSVRPSPAIETIAYFCAAELLTNVAKHAGASRATVEVTDDGTGLRLLVTDDGAGGARIVGGGGLAGLLERVRTVDGQLAVTSPVGGPTVAIVDLPLGV